MNFRQSLSFINTQALMKLKAQSNTLVLSYLWWILEPILYVALFYFVFKFVLYRGGEDFLAFLLIGKIPFLWFSKSVSAGANSIVENRGLISQRVIPKYIFPLVNCQEALYKQVLAFTILICFVLISGYGVTIKWMQLIPLTLITYLLICGVSLFFSVFVTLAPDFKVAIQMFMMGLMFTSGIFWNVNLIQDEMLKTLLMHTNPLASIIDGYRQILMYKTDLNPSYMLSVFLWAITASLLGISLLHKFSNTLTRKLFS